jgi:phytanoyl-CoA hydroxylase
VTLENGPLEVVPGTHNGPLHSHWHKGIFTGAVAENVASENKKNALSCIGKAGSACLMHSKLLHGSAPNRSSLPRSLFIITYKAEDAVALSPNHLPSDLVGMVVRGKETGTVRCTSYSIELPEYPKEVSFFGQQSKSKNIAM